MRLVSSAFAALLVATPAMADIQVSFIEGAPKDRFIVSSSGDCTLRNTNIVLDLTGSSHGLIFDTTAQGKGVEVFQPLEIVSGRSLLTATPRVRDGDQLVTLSVAEFLPGQSIAFTIDVDDTAGRSETMVSGAEITGATVSVKTPTSANHGTFDASSEARVEIQDCIS